MNFPFQILYFSLLEMPFVIFINSIPLIIFIIPLKVYMPDIPIIPVIFKSASIDRFFSLLLYFPVSSYLVILLDTKSYEIHIVKD